MGAFTSQAQCAGSHDITRKYVEHYSDMLFCLPVRCAFGMMPPVSSQAIARATCLRGTSSAQQQRLHGLLLDRWIAVSRMRHLTGTRSAECRHKHADTNAQAHMRDSNNVVQALAAQALDVVVHVLHPSCACARPQALEMSEEDLLSAACIHLAPALIQAAGPRDAGASGASAATVLETLTPLSASDNAAREPRGRQASAAALLRTYCEGIACCQDRFSNTVSRVKAAANALRYGLAALNMSAAGAEACQRPRWRCQAQPHPPRDVCRTMSTLVLQAAAALAAVVLQCTAAEAVAWAQSWAAEHAAQGQHSRSIQKPATQQKQQQQQQQQERHQSQARPAVPGAGGGAGRPGALTMKELADMDVLQLLGRTIVDAAAGSWLSDALLPVVSALLAAGALIPWLSAPDSLGSHGAAAMPVRDPGSSASLDAANAGSTAAAPEAAEPPVAWIEISAKAAAGGCAALVAAAVHHRSAKGDLGPKTDVTSHTDVIHGLSTMAASCQTLAGLVLVQSTREAALQAHAAPAINVGLQLVAQVPGCAEIACMLVPCCGALAATFSLVPNCDKGGGSVGGTSRSSRGRHGVHDTSAPSGAGDGRPDAWTFESATRSAEAVRMSWSDTCQQLSTR